MDMNVDIKPTPKQVAEMLSEMYADEHAEMFEHLYDLFEGEHFIMMQFMNVREYCVARGGIHGKAMGAFQAMFSSAYKYVW